MDFLQDLWLPIVVSAVFVWIASFLLHVVLPHHKKDWTKFPNEDKLMGALEGAAPGMHFFPFGSMEDAKNPEFIEKQKKGPNGTLVIWPGPVNMGRNLVLTLLFYLVVGLFVAYVGWHAMGPGPREYLRVFRVCGAAAFMAHGLGWMSFSIWFGGIKFWPNLFDAIVYALLTAGTFGWLWPKAVGG